MRPVRAAILAGGHASRLGGVDKSALVMGGRSILDRQLSLLRAIPADPVVVAPDPARFAHAGAPIIRDPFAAGPLGGLYTALVDAPTPYVVVLACDMPFVTRACLTRLLALASGHDGALPRDARGRHPLCAVYARAIAPRLRACLDDGQFRVGAALAGLNLRELGPEDLAVMDETGILLTNVNTPDEYARAAALLPETAAYRTSPPFAIEPTSR